MEEPGAKRLGVCVFFDEQGIIDRYAQYYLDELSRNLDTLVIVCNGPASPRTVEILESYTQRVIVRENIGYDAWAYKTGIEALGWTSITLCRELVLTNLTTYGPFYGFDSVFASMEQRPELDFWGISKHFGFSFDPIGYSPSGIFPPHIQTFFIVFRDKVLSSPAFRSFWDTLPPIVTHDEAVGLFETRLTQYLSDEGFRWDSFLDLNDLEELTADPFQIMPYDCLRFKGSPLIKRKFISCHEEMRVIYPIARNDEYESLRYIDTNTCYDSDLIIENLLRTCNQRDIADGLTLSYMIPSHPAQEPSSSHRLAFFVEVKECDSAFNWPQRLNILARLGTVAIMCSEGVREELLTNLNTKETVTFYVIDGEHTLTEGTNRYHEALLQTIQDNELVCVLHDIDHDDIPSINEYSGYTQTLDTIAGTAEAVKGVVNLFADMPRLGFLSPQPPVVPGLSDELERRWRTTFEKTEAWIREIGITVKTDISKPPVAALAHMYWVRGKLLRSYLGYSLYEHADAVCPEDDFALPLFVQSEGYLSGWCVAESTTRQALSSWSWVHQQIPVPAGPSTEELEDRISNLEHQLIDKNHELDDMRNSTSFRITKPLRTIKDILKP